MLIQGSAEIICDVVLTVRESACAAESAHDRTGLAVDAALYLIAVYGALTVFKSLAGLENSYLKIRS